MTRKRDGPRDTSCVGQYFNNPHANLLNAEFQAATGLKCRWFSFPNRHWSLTVALGVLSFEHRVNRRVGAYLVEIFLSPVLQGEFLRIDLWNTAGTNQNFLENVVAQGNQSAMQ